MEAQSTDPQEISVDDLHSGLKKVRGRRWILWLVILIYIPGLFVAMSAGLSSSTLSYLFFAWVGLLCVAVALATVVKCPGCNKTFHTNGPTFLPVRKCVHCGLGINADKVSK
jgi:hypothetical protein